MNDYRYHYMFTTFDIESFDLEDFKYNSVNITAFRLVDIGSKRVDDVLEQMQKFQHTGRDILNASTIVQVTRCLKRTKHGAGSKDQYFSNPFFCFFFLFCIDGSSINVRFGICFRCWTDGPRS